MPMLLYQKWCSVIRIIHKALRDAPHNSQYFFIEVLSTRLFFQIKGCNEVYSQTQAFFHSSFSLSSYFKELSIFLPSLIAHQKAFETSLDKEKTRCAHKNKGNLLVFNKKSTRKILQKLNLISKSLQGYFHSLMSAHTLENITATKIENTNQT